MENTPKNPASSSASSAANKSSQSSTSGVNRQNSPAAGASGDVASRSNQPSSVGGVQNSGQSGDVRNQQNQPSGTSRQNQSGYGSEQRNNVSGEDRNSWIDQANLRDTVNQLPQSIKDIGSKAAEQFNKLTTTQKVVGGALLLGGISYLASRSSGSRTSNLMDSATRRARDYRSGNIPRTESSHRSDWNKPSTSSSSWDKPSSETNRSFRKSGSETDTRFGSSSDYDNVL
jgi:hypothetical protein